MHLRLPLVLAFASGGRGNGGRDRNAPSSQRPGDSDEFEAQGPTVPWPNRRRGPRREDDLDEAQLRGWNFWAKVMFVHRAKLLAIVGPLSLAAGYTIAAMGLQARVKKLEEVTTATSERVSNLEDADQVKLYILCVLLREQHPSLVPPQCGVVEMPRAPLSPPIPRKR
jgi:hypothetical protein